MDIEHLIGQKLLFAFHGKETPSPEIIEAFQKYHPSGISYFRSLNIGTPSQVRELTNALQRLARDLDLPRLSTRGVMLRDAIVLVPSAAALTPARAGFARRGGWQPRIETTRTLAASLGPALVPQAPQLSFDAATDRLSATQILRGHAIGRSLARSDPRRLEHVVTAVVETAHALARAAQCHAPARRDVYWADARSRLTPTTGPGAQQRWLARIALEWAALAPEPATDRLFSVQPAAWGSVQAGWGYNWGTPRNNRTGN